MKLRNIILTAIAVFAVTLSARAQNLLPKEGYTIHTVQWFEDMHNISAKYGVPEDIIMKVNKLENRKLFTRQQIYIPINENFWSVEEKPAAEQTAEIMQDAASVPGEITEKRDSLFEQIPSVPEKKSEITFALVLPFTAKHEIERGNCLDFYSGVLMATKKLAEEGISIKLNVHDTKDEENLQQEGNDFILGPIKSDDIANILYKETVIPVVSPLDQKVETLAPEHCNLVQAPSNLAAQYEEAVRWACSLKSEKPESFIIITSPADTMSLRLARQSLDRAGKHYSICNCSVQGEVSGWERVFNPEGRNIVFLAASGEAVLNNALRNMVIESTKGEILSFAVSKIKTYETIPVENLHLANAHITCPYYVDYNDKATHDFIRTYRALYGTEPSQYAFQGYDLAYFMAKTYSELGRSWRNLAPTLPEMGMLQASFRLEHTESRALINHGMRRLEYTKDYKVESVK